MGIVVRQTVKGSVANYIGVAFGFINILLIMPWVFNPEEFGLIRMLIDSHVALASFAMLGISSSMYRYYPYFKADPMGKLHGFHLWALAVPFVGFLLICLALIAGGKWIVHYFSDNASSFLEYYLLLIPLAFSNIFFAVFEGFAALNERIVVPRILKEVLLRVLVASVFLLYHFQLIDFAQGVGLLVLVYVIPLVIIAFYIKKLAPLQLKPDWKFIQNNPEMVRDFFRYTALITIGSISGMVLSKIDQLMLSSKMGLDFSGKYMLAFHAAMIIEVPRRALIQIIQPRVSAWMKDNDVISVETIYKRTAQLLYIPGWVLLIALYVNMENLYRIIPNGQEYSSGKQVLLFIAVAKTIEMITCMGQVVIMYSRFYYVLFLMTIGTSVVGVMLNLWLIPLYGIEGAAVATLITLMLQQLIMVVTIYYKLRIHSFTMPLLWLTVIGVGVLGCHHLLPYMGNKWLDAGIRTLVFPTAFLWIMYKLRLNQEANRLIMLIGNRIKDRNFKPW